MYYASGIAHNVHNVGISCTVEDIKKKFQNVQFVPVKVVNAGSCIHYTGKRQSFRHRCHQLFLLNVINEPS